jgi:hypothetical protein
LVSGGNQPNYLQSYRTVIHIYHWMWLSYLIEVLGWQSVAPSRETPNICRSKVNRFSQFLFVYSG